MTLRGATLITASITGEVDFRSELLFASGSSPSLSSPSPSRSSPSSRTWSFRSRGLVWSRVSRRVTISVTTVTITADNVQPWLRGVAKKDSKIKKKNVREAKVWSVKCFSVRRQRRSSSTRRTTLRRKIDRNVRRSKFDVEIQHFKKILSLKATKMQKKT